MSLPAHRTGTVRSGDVDVFYRHCGEGGATPALILHGANYYDSVDWVHVASKLAGSKREVVAFDSRGYGESGWSANKDYSYAAQMADMEALLDHFGWKKVVLVGASRGGGYAILFATHFPDRVAAVVLVDYYPGTGVRHPGAPLIRDQSIGNKPKVFPSIDDWLKNSSRDKNAPPGSPARARIESFMKKVDGGYIISRRDPDTLNSVPVKPASWKTKIPIDIDTWGELAKVNVPVMLVVATQSAVGHTVEDLKRLRREYPQLTYLDIDSGHDVAGGAPDALVDGINSFLSNTRL
jgi:pimeloyl-ACP methyl ester carboxylesterase